MNIKVVSADISVTEAMREHVERRVCFALSRFGEEVRSVSVKLSNFNDPHCGDRKGCQIDVTLEPAGTVITRNADADVTVAIDRAAERTGRAVSRVLRQRRPASRL